MDYPLSTYNSLHFFRAVVSAWHYEFHQGRKLMWFKVSGHTRRYIALSPLTVFSCSSAPRRRPASVRPLRGQGNRASTAPLDVTLLSNRPSLPLRPRQMALASIFARRACRRNLGCSFCGLSTWMQFNWELNGIMAMSNPKFWLVINQVCMLYSVHRTRILRESCDTPKFSRALPIRTLHPVTRTEIALTN